MSYAENQARALAVFMRGIAAYDAKHEPLNITDTLNGLDLAMASVYAHMESGGLPADSLFSLAHLCIICATHGLAQSATRNSMVDDLIAKTVGAAGGNP